MRPIATLALSAVSASLFVGCDGDAAHPDTHPEAAAVTAVATAAPAPPEVRAPDIVVDPAYIAVGNDRVIGGDPGLADRVSVFLNGRPMIEGRTVDVVVMRNAKPSQVSAVLVALKRAKATGAGIKTEARDDSTQRLPMSFDGAPQPCTTIAWIAKDASIDAWPVGGGTAKRIFKGLAGPDMTLGTEAVRSVGARCDASELVVGADEAMSWGLVFDLATMVLQAPGARTSKAVLVASAVPGRKLVVE
jgi:hypothetical protein